MNFEAETFRYDLSDLAADLCALYGGAGYGKYRMRKFEEYSLYLENKNFLASEHVIAFNGLDGKLLALKPDVTLSIVKNTTASEEAGEKLYYSESVYRLDRKSREYREIGQIGLEMLGGVDAVGTCEVCALALESLSLISERSVLAISHMGFLDAVFRSLGIADSASESLLACLGAGSAHELLRVADGLGLEAETASRLAALIAFDSDDAAKLEAARALAVTDEAAAAERELETILSELSRSGYSGRLHLDFSIVSDRGYYNGIVFAGYIDGVPKAVLSGGRYDRLTEKFGKNLSALGFAVYLNELSYYLRTTEEYDADYLLLYGEGDTPSAVWGEAERLRTVGSVRVSKTVPEGLRFREIRHVGEVD